MHPSKKRCPMNHMVKRSVVTLLAVLLGVVVAPPVFPGQGGPSPLVPPQSNAFGKSFEAWNVLQTQWAIKSELGVGTPPSDTVGRVRFLPVDLSTPDPPILIREFDITLSPGTPFVAAPFFVFGERYEGYPTVPDDDPVALAPVLEEIFKTAQIRTELDGQVLLEGTGTALGRFLFGPAFFDEPIVYEEPIPRGPGLNAIAALWVTGIGSVYNPLPVGEHTLVYTVTSVFGHLEFTYHITVSP
jgi:hypothetical protein